MDPVTATVLAATVVPLAGGAAGEAGKQAWNSLLRAVRKHFGRDAVAIEDAVASGDAARVESAMGEVVRLAERDAGFAECLRDWLRAAAPPPSQPADVWNVIGEQAEVSGGLVQAHTINGPVTFGASPATTREPRGSNAGA